MSRPLSRFAALAGLAAGALACSTPPAAGDPHPGPLPPTENGQVPPVEDLPPTVGPGWLRGTLPADLPVEGWIHGAALHVDVEEAQARAEVALALSIWGPLAKRPTARMLPSFFLPEHDVTRTELVPDGRTAVLVALERRLLGERMIAWLDEANGQLAARRPEDTPSGRLSAAIANAELRMLESFTCERLGALAAGACPQPPAGDHPLTLFGTLMHLEAKLVGGVPRLPGKIPLRPAGVCLRYQNSRGELIPWPAVALRFDAPPGTLVAEKATTAADGCAEVGFSAVPRDELRIIVRVQAEPLVGELAGHFPDVTTELRLRSITAASARIAVHLFEHVLGRSTQEAVTAEATVAALRRHGYANAAVLEANLAATLVPAKTGAVDEALAQLLARSAGAADILVLGEIHSDFLSRAIGRTLWHEANLALRVFDLWTGEALEVMELSTRAQGLGDEEAARNAMAELGQKLADQLHQLFGKVSLSNRRP